MQAISVSTLNEQIKSLLETTFLQVLVEGEISRPTYHGSGHVYFSIKDENSQLKAVMFRGNASKLKFRLEDGMKVVLYGAITLFKPRGEYQINVSHVEVDGVGNLALAFKQLKEKLQNEGLFLDEHKKARPKAISHIILITSGTGAALQDMLRLISKRWPMIKLTLVDVLVQGDQASGQITHAIQHADSLGADALIISRGGGSVEDLWAFNEENVAQALYHAKTFTVSAVGHEIDWVISDYVADMRAATPTAAIELLLPDQWEMQQYLDQLASQFHQRFHTILTHAQTELSTLRTRFSQYSIENRLTTFSKEMDQIKIRLDQYFLQKLTLERQHLQQTIASLDQSMRMNLSQKEQQLRSLEQGFNQMDPKLRDKKGYVELTKDGEKFSIEDVAVHDRVSLSSSRISLDALITARHEL